MLANTDTRKEEIINACMWLYDEYNFKDITIKLISEHTTFSRPSIYNYFETKEEIFLAIFQKEYEEWKLELDAIKDGYENLNKDEFADLLAKTLAGKERLLKLLSMNMYDLEENSRIERLTEFKKAYGSAVEAVFALYQKFFPDKNERESYEFAYTFFPFVFGVYPYAILTNKQKEAMEKANISYPHLSIYELAYMGIKKILG